MLLAHIPSPAGFSVLASVRFNILSGQICPNLMIAVRPDLFGNRIRGTADDIRNLPKRSMLPQSPLDLIAVFPG
jgi:hypothetical protein